METSFNVSQVTLRKRRQEASAFQVILSRKKGREMKNKTHFRTLPSQVILEIKAKARKRNGITAFMRAAAV